MHRGNIDPDFEDQATIIVVDQELIFTLVRKRWKFWDYDIGLNDFHRRVIRYLIRKKKKTGADKVIVVSTQMHETKLEKTVRIFLGLRVFDTVQIEDEQTYKTWLTIIDPVVHYSTFERMNYHRATVQMTTEVLDNNL